MSAKKAKRISRTKPKQGTKQSGGKRSVQNQKAKKQVAKAPNKKLWLRLYILMTVLAAIIVMLFIGYEMAFEKPELNLETQLRPGSTEVIDEETGEVIAPAKDSTRRSEDFYTVLVVGRDTGGGGNTDTIMLVSYDVTNQNLAVMSIPRDTMVNLAMDIKKINAVYNYYGQGEAGITALKQIVGDTTGVYPDFHVIVEWEAVGLLGDAVGGIEFDVPLAMKYSDPLQDLYIDIPKGLQVLDGDDIMKVLRYRMGNNGSGYADGDIGRIDTQQDLLMAIASEMLQTSTITKIPELVTIFAENVETDLTLPNILWFAKAAIEGGLDVANVRFETLPANYNGYAWSRLTKSNQSYVLPYASQIVELVNEAFNPYLEDITRDDLGIMYKNSDGTIGYTAGSVKDSSANSAWLAAKAAAAEAEEELDEELDDESLLGADDDSTDKGNSGSSSGDASAENTSQNDESTGTDKDEVSDGNEETSESFEVESEADVEVETPAEKEPTTESQNETETPATTSGPPEGIQF